MVIKACQEIESALGALTLLVHHQAKNANKARPTPRGASNLPAAADVILHVSRAASRVTLRTAKQKNGEEIADLRFGVKVVDVGERDGERQTSLVLVPDEASVAPELTGTGLRGTILEALALLPEGITASDLAERIEGRRKASGSLNRALVDLVERGLVQKQGRTYVIAQSQASVANLRAA